MNTTLTRYTIIGDVPAAWFDQDTNTSVSGRKITARSLQTQRVVTVNVPTADYTPDGVNTAVLAAVQNLDAVAQLGQA